MGERLVDERVRAALPSPIIRCTFGGSRARATVAQPNEWAKVARHAESSPKATELGLRYQRFFGDVLARLKAKRPSITNASRVGAQNWFTFSAGRSGFSFGWTFAIGQRLRSELSIDVEDAELNKAFFDRLEADRGAIEREVGFELTRERLDDKRASRIAVYVDSPQSPSFDENQALKAWAVDSMTALNDCFRPRLRAV